MGLALFSFFFRAPLHALIFLLFLYKSHLFSSQPTTRPANWCWMSYRFFRCIGISNLTPGTVLIELNAFYPPSPGILLVSCRYWAKEVNVSAIFRLLVSAMTIAVQINPYRTYPRCFLRIVSPKGPPSANQGIPKTSLIL